MRKIGFIGLGIMGQPMAKNLLRAGYSLMVYNRTIQKTTALKKEGALVASTPREIGDWADVIILMLTGPEAIEEVLLSDNGVLKSQIQGKQIINMSTVSPAFTLRLQQILKEHSVELIDAPVSGSKKPAEEGTLVILAAGQAQRIKELEPLLLSMGKKVIYCGEIPKGSAMKMTVNLLLGSMMEALAEALNFGQQAGLSSEVILDTIVSGPLSCGLYQIKKEMLLKNEYPVQFPLKHMLKDLRFILQTADEIGAPVPTGHSIFQLYRQAFGMGLGDSDFAAVKKALEKITDSL